MKYIAILILIAILASCGQVQNNQDATDISSATQAVETEDNSDINTQKSEVDLDLKDSETVYVTLDSDNTISGDDGIQITGQKVIIKKSGNYEFTGSLTDGQMVIETEDEKAVQVILNNVSITNSRGGAFVVENANQTIINLAANSSNSLVDGEDYEEIDDTPNAALFSRDDLVIMGEGELKVIANHNDGITSKDDLFILGGSISVEAVDDGIRGKNLLLIEGGDIMITADGDGLKSDDEEKGTIEINGGTIKVTAGDDGINASMSIVINNGTVTVSKSYEALESQSITINGGDTYLTSSDDGINVTSDVDVEGGGEATEDISLKINGGNLTLDANGDGLDSNGDIIMTGGNVIVYGPTQDNNGALDFNGEFTISGGDLIAIGSSGMAEAPGENSSQNSIIIGLDSQYPAKSEIVIKNSEGSEIFTLTSLKSFQAIVVSSSDVEKNSEYTLEIDNEIIENFSTTGVVTTIGEVGKGGGGGFGR